MELILSLFFGILAASGTWLLLRPRTFQVLIGLSLLSYAVNLFIFSMGWVRDGLPPFVQPGATPDAARFADPLPQALVLTAIVIAFATTALLLVVVLAARGMTGTDHVDGHEGEDE
jgi:multicomponent K+:H+ antiporter subunit C